MNNFDLNKWPYRLKKEIVVLSISIEGNPISKARPRFSSKGRPYNPQRQKDYEEFLKWKMKEKLNGIPNSENEFGLRCLFYRDSKHRIDCDNMLKMICDAANGIVWKDDAQCLEVHGRVFKKDENPRTEILFYLISDGDGTPSSRCEACNKLIKSYKSSPVKFCSRACSLKDHRTIMQCTYCKKSFSVQKCLVNRGRSKFCSVGCTSSHYGAIKSKIHQQKYKCEICKGPVSRPEYKKCKRCHLGIIQKTVLTPKIPLIQL